MKLLEEIPHPDDCLKLYTKSILSRIKLDIINLQEALHITQPWSYHYESRY